MDLFIKNQLKSFKGKKYKKKVLINEKNYGDRKKDILPIIIKDNKIINQDIKNYSINKKIYRGMRIRCTLLLLNELLKRKKIKDTVLLIFHSDSYLWDKDLPTFNYAVPDGKQGLIFPNFDVIYFNYLNKNFNEIKKNTNNYNPKTIINDIYFKGAPNTLKNLLLREKLSKESLPFNVDLNTDSSEPVYFVKKHKYLLDLPGWKPQSMRFKYLLLSKRLIFRISIYDSKIGEKSYWKQFYDFLFDDKKDYIHLIYDLSYYEKLSNKNYNKIKNDILTQYNYYEKNPKKYIQKVESLNKNAKKLNLNLVYDYLEKLINSYTDNLLID